MKRLALIAVAGIALAGCGSSHESSPTSQPRHLQHYPVVIHSPLVTALGHARTTRASIHEIPRLVSPTRLRIVTVGSGSCPWVPDELTVLGPDAISVHLSLGTFHNRKLVTHPLPNGCTLDLGPTPMLVAIDPKQIDVHRPLTVHIGVPTVTKTGVVKIAPLKS
jgi:hypothetical protein